LWYNKVRKELSKMLNNEKRQVRARPVVPQYVKASEEEVLKALKESNKKNHIALGLLAK
jgi:hypothetical protein